MKILYEFSASGKNCVRIAVDETSRDAVYEWLRENAPLSYTEHFNPFFITTRAKEEMVITFDDPSTAVLFKLRWS